MSETTLQDDNRATDAITIKVKSSTNPNAAAGSIFNVISDHGFAHVLAIGAGAVNQAVKAVIICRGYLSPIGKEIIMQPSFDKAMIDGKETTRIKFEVGPR